MAENSKMNGLITQQIYGGVAQKYTGCDITVTLLRQTTKKDVWETNQED
jgi:hypothetical protein